MLEAGSGAVYEFGRASRGLDEMQAHLPPGFKAVGN